jgi:hypothetical protein
MNTMEQSIHKKVHDYLDLCEIPITLDALMMISYP